MRKASFLLAVVSAAGMAFQISSASATVTGGSSSSYAESVDLAITPLILGVSGSVTSGPLPISSGTAPSPYIDSNSLLSVTIADLLATGVLNSSASSNVDGSNGAKFAHASASVDALGVNILNALGLGLTAVDSTAGVSGDYGALDAVGTTTITGLTLNNVPVVNVGATPNDVLLNLAGIRIVLNEQTGSGDGIGAAAIGVNAIHIALTDVPYLWGTQLSLLNGDIIISHSEAQLMAVPTSPANGVPEPASLALLGTGLVGFFGLRKRLAA